LDLRGKNNRRLEKLHNEGLHNLYFLPDIISMIKVRRFRLARHVTSVGEKRKANKDFGTKT
jgi:hypothetical protein